MKVFRVTVRQELYCYPDNRGDYILKLQPGDIILCDETSQCTFTEVNDNFSGPDVLKSWIAIFEGRVGWISSWESKPEGIDEIP